MEIFSSGWWVAAGVISGVLVVATPVIVDKATGTSETLQTDESGEGTGIWMRTGNVVLEPGSNIKAYLGHGGRKEASAPTTRASTSSRRFVALPSDEQGERRE